MMEEVQLKTNPEDVAPPLQNQQNRQQEKLKIYTILQLHYKQKTNTTRSKQEVALFHKYVQKNGDYIMTS